MKTRTIAIAVLAATLGATFAAQAQTVYRWTDKDGKVQFSDQPPPADAKDATQRRVGGGSTEDTQLPYATQVAARRNPVTLFTGTDCGDPCVQGRALLTSRGIPFTERDAQNNPADQEALKKLIGGLDVPLLLVGSSQMKGFEESTWQSSLDSAGYPRTRLPGQAPLRPAAPPEAPPKPAEGTASDTAPK
jgi:glutaredoxin